MQELWIAARVAPRIVPKEVTPAELLSRDRPVVA